MENENETRANDGRFKKGNTIGKQFSSENQPSPKAKSDGKIMKNLREKLIEQVAEELFDAKAPKIAVEKAINDALENNNAKNLIDLLKLIKKPDKMELESNIDVKQLVLEVVDDGAGTGTDEDAAEVSAADYDA